MSPESGGPSRVTRRRRRWRGRGPLRTTLVALVLAGWILGSLRMIYGPVAIRGFRPDEDGDMVLCAGGMLRNRVTGREERLAPFFIDRFEVTRAEYARFLEAHPGRPRPRGFPPRGAERPLEGGELPVTWVSWHDSAAFAAWRGKRLPTYSEWTLVARGENSQAFPWGAAAQHLVANTAELGLGRTTPVGLFEDGRSGLGIYDLVGNAAEWTGTAAGVVFPDRYFVLGGSFRGRLFPLGRDPPLLETHIFKRLDPRDAAELPAWYPAEQVLRGPGFVGGDVGLRCALDAPPDHVWELIADLGYRDPLGYVMHTRPAMRALRDVGPICVRYLEAAARRVDDETVRRRLRDLADEIGGDAP